MNIIRDVVMPIVKIANKLNAEKIEYEERDNAVRIWIYADVNEEMIKQIVSLQYDLMRRYGIDVEIVIKT